MIDEIELFGRRICQGFRNSVQTLMIFKKYLIVFKNVILWARFVANFCYRIKRRVSGYIIRRFFLILFNPLVSSDYTIHLVPYLKRQQAFRA